MSALHPKAGMGQDVAMRATTVPGRNARRAIVATCLVVAIVGTVGFTGPVAWADKETRAVQRSGACTGPTDWKLVLRHGDPGQLVVVFTASGGATDQKWNVFMENKGNGIFSDSRTSGDDGFFRVKKVTRDLQGIDKILVGANNAVTGETCTARASL